MNGAHAVPSVPDLLPYTVQRVVVCDACLQKLRSRLPNSSCCLLVQIPETVLALPVFYKQRENKVRDRCMTFFEALPVLGY